MDSLKWIGFQILRKMKGRKPKRYENSDSEEISFPEESVEYDFITIQNATNNFSKKNRIGEGGFGVVYKVNLAFTLIWLLTFPLFSLWHAWTNIYTAFNKPHLFLPCFIQFIVP
nr:cysteine-rich receptor-like protein kinase 10 [Ipomoea batatas]